MDVLHKNGYPLDSYCGGAGTCGKCRVLLTGGQNPVQKETELLTTAEIEKGVRLACLTEVHGDMLVELTAQDDMAIITSGHAQAEIHLDPLVKKKKFELERPSLEDQRGYMERILGTVGAQKLNFGTLGQLAAYKDADSITAVIVEGEIISLSTTDVSIFGIAADIGTTSIVLYLVDLETGDELDIYSFMNPQKKYGADIITRINHTIKKREGTTDLQQVLVVGLSEGIGALCERNKLDSENIVQMTIVGNTTMLHTLVGVETATIARAPYIPLFTSGLNFSPEQLGLPVNCRGQISLLPSISAYVGADIVADILACGLNKNKKSLDLLLDVGTNGEIVLTDGDTIWACATAAGPAFEGSNITFGMAGFPGAIDTYAMDSSGNNKYTTIKGKEARGICGSGLVDIIAGLLKFGFIDNTGRFLPVSDMTPWQRQQMGSYQRKRAFQVAKKGNGEIIYLTQGDIRELQLAKGAIAGGLKILLKEAEKEIEDINNCYIAGGFGNYLKAASACKIKMIPPEMETNIVPAGNAAGTGAKMFMLDKRQKEFALQALARVRYIELSSRQDFQDEFMASMYF